jgi:SynChlorMet cassette protein ScmD
MAKDRKPVANPDLVLREEFDDWAVLFDPDTGEAFGLDPVGVFLWKCCNGQHTPAQILENLHNNCTDVPADAAQHLQTFLEELESKGYIGYSSSK